jgi:hypothetical protein
LSSINCFQDQGIDVNVVSLPFNEGWDNLEVIHKIDDHYDFARGQTTKHLFFLHCDMHPGSIGEDCRPYLDEEQTILNTHNRYNLHDFSHDTNFSLESLDEALMFEKFILYVTQATPNTETETIALPSITYHRVVLNHVDPESDNEVTVTLLDAEMKYLKDNGFVFFTAKDLEYDELNNTITLSPPT